MSVPAIFLVVCKDNYGEVVRTFNSIFTQLSDFDEILIVDSSSAVKREVFLLISPQCLIVLFIDIYHRVEFMMRKIIALNMQKTNGFVLSIRRFVVAIW